MGANFDVVLAANSLIEQGRFDEARSCYADDLRGVSPTYDFEGVDAWIEAIQAQNGPFSDVATTMTPVAELDDRVVFEWEWQGTHSGTISAAGFELPPTGKRISMRGMAVFEFADGRISSFRQYWDNAAVAAQFMS